MVKIEFVLPVLRNTLLVIGKRVDHLSLSLINRYRDKHRPGEYMCKSCYVCLNRKKGGKNGLEAGVVRQRRRPVVREDFQDRICNGCESSHSSGDWFEMVVLMS